MSKKVCQLLVDKVLPVLISVASFIFGSQLFEIYGFVSFEQTVCSFCLALRVVSFLQLHVLEFLSGPAGAEKTILWGDVRIISVLEQLVSKSHIQRSSQCMK